MFTGGLATFYYENCMISIWELVKVQGIYIKTVPLTVNWSKELEKV